MEINDSKDNVQKERVLRLISPPGGLRLESLSGTALIADSWDVFGSGVSVNFDDWDLNHCGPATPEVLVNVHEMISEATFDGMLTCLSSKLDDLIMTQHQIIRFCVKYREWLRSDECANFFPIKGHGQYFVVAVLFILGFPAALVYRPNRYFLWDANSRRRIISLRSAA